MPKDVLPIRQKLSAPDEKGEAQGASSVAVSSSASPPATRSSKTRWKEIAEDVRHGIETGRLSAGDVLLSETALTEKWKVSRMTAHRAMQELQRSGLITRQRGRGTRVAGAAPKVNSNVALLFDNPLNQLEVEYMQGINAGLAKDYQLLLCNSHSDVKQEAEYLERMQKEAQGIICMLSCDPKNTPLLRSLIKSGFPVVCVDRIPLDLKVDAVVSDNYGATTEALKSLLALGHRQIAHFTASEEMQVSAVRERYQAFMDVMSGVEGANPERLLRFLPSGCQNSFEIIVQVAHDALFTLRHQADPITAVFCHNDYMLTVVLAAIEQLKIRIPEDIEVLSFYDTLTLTPSVSARLHRIVQQPKRIGQLAAERLKLRIERRDLPPEIVRVPATLCSLQANSLTPFK